MPQMSPINWLMLFVIFSFSLILFNTMNYFLFDFLTPKLNLYNKKFINKLNWKW